ncbi:hypothetical protein CMUS01_03607 [Colletotrichum musicola]|uniref:Uncharacterized protein n=1 Tax=Colletotrichum musicola TaxID=2175873 RepID=A0A8H6U5D1_9PEZI|nr:hypothetical protein CMUS01_03607 [Colletotrichum musicola]
MYVEQNATRNIRNPRPVARNPQPGHDAQRRYPGTLANTSNDFSPPWTVALSPLWYGGRPSRPAKAGPPVASVSPVDVDHYQRPGSLAKPPPSARYGADCLPLHWLVAGPALETGTTSKFSDALFRLIGRLYAVSQQSRTPSWAVASATEVLRKQGSKPARLELAGMRHLKAQATKRSPLLRPTYSHVHAALASSRCRVQASGRNGDADGASCLGSGDSPRLSFCWTAARPSNPRIMRREVVAHQRFLNCPAVGLPPCGARRPGPAVMGISTHVAACANANGTPSPPTGWRRCRS